ncbi:MAG TPA: pitrilysin family protein [Candidatus Lustribacter sp.]|nr:pitrilysin family protein [Candidatus Lustribacter sp.]
MTSTASGAGIAVAPIDFTDRTLPNGLRVLLVEDHRVPSVSINVGYRVGGKDDPPGRSGFAHLFEHLMFKGTKNTRPETIDRLTEDIGGLNNAFTADDITNYYEVVPSNYLETLLWAEADRLGSLAVIEEHFHTERDVVIGEYDQRILAEPYGMLDELVNRESFAVHPYRRGVIGDPENLRAATLDDVVAFHRTFYRPDNAVLVVVGDLDPVQTNAWIDKYFGRVPKPAAPIPRVTSVEPPQTAERTYTYRAANVPLPAVEYAYHIPEWRHPDAPALDIVETLLGMGKSSRLYQSLVYTQRVATSAHASADLREQPGLFSLRAIASTGTPIEAVRTALDAEIARLHDELPASAEMDRVRTQIASSLVRSRQTYNNIAVALVRSAIERDDPGALNSDLDRYRAVTEADVQRVARRYLTPENRTTIEYLPL